MNKNCLGKLRYTVLLIVLSFSVVVVKAQGFYNTTNWKFSNPKQFGFTILDVDYFDNNNVIAVGSDGGIAKSVDGGSNWTYGPFTFVRPNGLITKQSFSDVHYITATTAYAVGTGGLMAKTTDGGQTWSFVTTPLYANSKSINSCWFLDANKGYIGGQVNNTPDSLPKLYFTLNGGATWDSITAPASNGVSRVGYINNTNIPSVLYPVDSKMKEIQRIEISSTGIGYICGSGSPLFPRVSPRAISSTNCLPGTSFLTTSAHTAALLWKFNNGVLTDYSLSKERIGYTGINTNTINCTTGYSNLTPSAQTYRAMNIINDTTVVLMSFNNNTVVKVNTGVNDMTPNINNGGALENGKYEVLNFPFPPTGGPNAGPPIPNPQVLLASNPYQIRRTSNGTLIANGNFSRMWTSVDTGRNWVESRSLPSGQNYSITGVWALDIAPNGKFLSMGANGVVADSLPGSPNWNSNYLAVPLAAGYSKIEFADCSNGIAAGGASITVTTDGGATWIDKRRTDFANSNYFIGGMSYPSIDKAYFAVSSGQVYFSSDKGTTLDPVFTDFTFRMNDVATSGPDSVWAIGYTQFTVPTASRTSRVFRSTDGGANWSTYSGFSVGSLAQNLTDIEFPTNLIGYAAGNRDTIYKTTDGGGTWNKLPLPTPGVLPQITYTDLFALDENTVFLTGNGFPRKVIFKTTDGGATWTEITNNILSFGGGNLNGIIMHDVNNGYAVSPGGTLFKTNDGGASWTLDIAPIGTIFTSLAFAPKKVPAGISVQNRKLFVTGDNISGAPMMEYGSPANINVNATETVTNASCTNLTGGSITVNATGAIAPYTYSIDGITFQSSNTFTGLTQGPKTITIKDAFCGMLTKTVNVGFNDNLTLTTNNDTTVCAGAPVQMRAISAATSYTWSPAGGLSATNISNPIATVNSNAAYTVTASLNGCVRTNTVNITIKPNPVVNAGPDKTIVEGDQVLLSGNSNSTPVSIAWAPASSIVSGISTFAPLVKPNITTTYTMTVLNLEGCTSTDDAVVTVIPYCVKVMDAFTPNGDGQNDRWLVTNGSACTSKISVTVFNRYGGKVYQNDNYQNNWEGTYNGKSIADGTYYYVIIYRLINGQSITMKGDVTILR